MKKQSQRRYFVSVLWKYIYVGAAVETISGMHNTTKPPSTCFSCLVAVFLGFLRFRTSSLRVGFCMAHSLTCLSHVLLEAGQLAFEAGFVRSQPRVNPLDPFNFRDQILINRQRGYHVNIVILMQNQCAWRQGAIFANRAGTRTRQFETKMAPEICRSRYLSFSYLICSGCPTLLTLSKPQRRHLLSAKKSRQAQVSDRLPPVSTAFWHTARRRAPALATFADRGYAGKWYAPRPEPYLSPFPLVLRGFSCPSTLPRLTMRALVGGKGVRRGGGAWCRSHALVSARGRNQVSQG